MEVRTQATAAIRTCVEVATFVLMLAVAWAMLDLIE
jgi:hypothetical protein